MSAFKETYPSYGGDAILGEWINESIRILQQPIHPYVAQRQFADYLEGIWNFGHQSGFIQRDGENLITLLKASENE